MSVLCEPRDAWGRPRSPVTLAAYRLGVAPANKGKLYPAEILTPDEVHRLIGACSRRSPSGLRNRALLVVLWRAGLRISEALALEAKDVDLDARTITVLSGKGKRRRTVSIDPGACAIVGGWITERRRLAIRRGPLFCTISRPMCGGPVRSAYVRELLKDLAVRAGIEKRVHPHGLRHTMAYELVCEGVPLPLVQRQLGHSSLATTARYVDHFAPTELIRVMGERSFQAA